MEQDTPIGLEKCGDGTNSPLLDSKTTQGEPVPTTKHHSNSTSECPVNVWACPKESLLVEEGITAVKLECKQSAQVLLSSLQCEPSQTEQCLIVEQTFKNVVKDSSHSQSPAEESAEGRQSELNHSRAQDGNIAIELNPSEANLIEAKCAPQKVSSSEEENSEDHPANISVCDIICPEYTTGMEGGSCTPMALVLGMHSDAQSERGSVREDECGGSEQDTNKCTQILGEVDQNSATVNEYVMLMPQSGREACQQVQLPGEVDQNSALVNEEVMLMPQSRTESCQQVQLPGEVDQNSALVNEDIMLMPQCGTEVCQQVQLPGEVDQNSALVNEGVMLVPQSGTEVCQQVQLPGEDVQSSTPLCQDVQLPNKFDDKCSAMVEEQGEMVWEDTYVGPAVEVRQKAEDVASMPRPAVSGCKSGWCGAMELVVLSSVGVEEEKFSFIESDNELEEDESSRPDVTESVGRCEEVYDNKEKPWELSIESDKEREGSSKEVKLSSIVTDNVADNCDSSNANQQDCTGVKRCKEDLYDFPLVLGVDEEGNEPASKRPRHLSEAKHEVCVMEPEIVCEGLQTTDEPVADDGNETILQGLPTESASLWPVLPSAPPCQFQLRREDDNDGGSPPDDGESGQAYSSTCREQACMSTSDCDNQLVPEECFQDRTQIIPHESFQVHMKSYSLYSDTHAKLDKSVSTISNSLEQLESLPSVHMTPLPFADQVTPLSLVDIGHQARYPSRFEQREAIASKLSQTRVAPMNPQQSGAISRKPRLRLGLSKKQKTKPLHLN